MPGITKAGFTSNIGGAILGLFLGAAIAICLGGIMVLIRVGQLRSDPSSIINAEVQNPPHAPDSTHVGEYKEVLDQAEKYILEGAPQKTIDFLGPIIGLIDSKQDLKEAYTLLSGAEAQLGHYQIAAVYAEKINEIEPTAANRYYVAVLYDIGGNLWKAYNEYYFISLSEEEGADKYRELAMTRSEELSAILFDPTPTMFP